LNITDVLMAAGEPIELSSNRPVAVSDENYCYIALSENIDVFLIKIIDGEPAGIRNFVFKAKKGDIVFPAVKSSSVGDCSFLISGLPGSGVLKLRIDVFFGIFKEHVGELTGMITTWARSLAAAIAVDTASRETVFVQPGKFPLQKGSILCSNDFSIIRFNSGSAVPFGYSKISAGGEKEYLLFPKHLWLEIFDDCEAEAVGPGLFFETEFSPGHVKFFGELLLNCLILYFESKKIIEAERLVEKEKMDGSFMRSSLAAFLGVLKKGGGETAGYYKYENPLLCACHIIGENLGQKISPPAGEIGNSDIFINEIAGSSNIKVRQVVLRGEWWRMDTGPLLAFLEEGNAPVALLPMSPSSYKMINPAKKSSEALSAESADLFKSVAYTFYKPFPDRPLGIFDLLNISCFAVWKRDIVFVILMGLLVGVLNLVTPYATGMIFDTIIPGSEKTQLAQLAMGLVICSISTFLFQMTRAVSTLRLEGKMDYVIQAAVWDRLLGLPVTFFRNYNSGDLEMRAMGINQIRMTLSSTVLSTVMSGVFSVFYLFLLFYYNFKMALFAIGLIIIAILFTLFCGYFRSSYLKASVELDGKISGISFQIINGLSKFKIAGAERRAFYLWAQKFAERKKISIDSAFFEIVLQTFNSLYPIVCSMVIFYLMIHYTTKDAAALSTGSFMSFYSAYSSLLGSLMGLSSVFLVILQILPVYERTRPILESVPEFDETKINAGELKGKIELSNVSFRYKKDLPLVLDKVNISIDPGEFVAIVGSSGSGKSTLLRMLLGFEVPESGAVYYDSQDLSKVDLKSVRRQAGVVLQNGRLLAGDIYTNIVGSYNLTVDNAWEAARMAGFDRDIEKMPMGMNTVVSEGGSTLSGGQRQRLLIARALVNKPKIIFFDEATSALDNTTQEIVSRSLEALKSTRVIIAHRLSTVIKADKIYVIDKGKVAESGNFKELMNNKGLFAELAKRQM